MSFEAACDVVMRKCAFLLLSVNAALSGLHFTAALSLCLSSHPRLSDSCFASADPEEKSFSRSENRAHVSLSGSDPQLNKRTVVNRSQAPSTSSRLIQQVRGFLTLM